MAASAPGSVQHLPVWCRFSAERSWLPAPFRGSVLTFWTGFFASGSGLRTVALSVSCILKNAIVPCSCSAWEASSSAVEAISSAAPAFCWITWFSCWIAPLIWSRARVLLLGGCADLLHQLGGLLDVRHQLRQHGPGPFGDLDARSGQLADLAGRRLAPLGELPHLGGHDGKALAVLAGPRRLDGGVKRQEVRLARDLLDDRDLARRSPSSRATASATALPLSRASFALL